MKRLLAWLVLLAALVPLQACFGSGLGLEAWLRVPGGQYVEGPMPDDQGGPEVVALRVTQNVIIPGERGKPIEGSLAASATGVAIGLEGDTGYWLVPAGLPAVIEPDFPSFVLAVDVSRELPVEDHQLIVRAVDAEGRFGPEMAVTLAAQLTPLPDALLIVSLTWDSATDLDLHVIDPDGVEIFKRDINSFQLPPPGEPPPPPSAALEGGILDFDSNAQCVIDGRCQENVIWTVKRPAGHYIARVDTYSLCGEPEASWTVRVFAEGELIAEAQGIGTVADERLPHDRGAGVTAVEFDLP